MNEVSENALLKALQISDGKKQAVFVFVLMKKINNCGIRNGCFCCPFIKLAALTIIFIFPCIHTFFFYGSSLHSIKKYFSALYGGETGRNRRFKRNYLGHVLVDEKHDLACSPKGQQHPGQRQRECSQQGREVILPLCFVLVRTHLECYIHLWSPQHRKDVDLLEGHKNDQRGGAPPL